MNYYIQSEDVDNVRKFFSVLPEEQRPKIFSDKENPGIWDHVGQDGTSIIVTEEPRVDTEVKALTIEGRQAEEVMSELSTEGADIVSEDPAITTDEPPAEEEPIKGPLTFADRGFKVGKVL